MAQALPIITASTGVLNALRNPGMQMQPMNTDAMHQAPMGQDPSRPNVNTPMQAPPPPPNAGMPMMGQANAGAVGGTAGGFYNTPQLDAGSLIQVLTNEADAKRQAQLQRDLHNGIRRNF